LSAKPFNSNNFLPLKPLDFQVLTLLASREQHGYGIVQTAEIEFPDQPALEIGSLYRIISRLFSDGLIREVEAPADSPSDRRVRRFYGATDTGFEVVRAEARRMRSLLAAPATKRLLEARG
jgi:DNA-binding PadR family transcriptional regulator